MATNRRRHANAIPLASFATWGVVALCALGGGLGYVWCKNQLYTTGTEIRALERELAGLRNKNEVTRSKIAQLSSTATLNERYASGFIDLVPITNDLIVVVDHQAPKARAGELRPASNERDDE